MLIVAPRPSPAPVCPVLPSLAPCGVPPGAGFGRGVQAPLPTGAPAPRYFAASRSVRADNAPAHLPSPFVFGPRAVGYAERCDRGPNRAGESQAEAVHPGGPHGVRIGLAPALPARRMVRQAPAAEVPSQPGVSDPAAGK